MSDVTKPLQIALPGMKNYDTVMKPAFFRERKSDTVFIPSNMTDSFLV
jgi:hypothetical protein